MTRIVVALGGNALLRRGEPFTADVQRKNVRSAVESLSGLCEQNDLVITHGNGPQVGLLALQSEAYSETEPYPLDILSAESQGMIGYLIEEELRNSVDARHEIATILTQVIVDPDDNAFESPTKPIGPVYAKATATKLATKRGWSIGQDGDGWRRLVPSPEPQRILEIRPISLLLDAGVTVICAGGGGVPLAVIQHRLRGVEAVVDKDLTAALLASSLGADALLLLTDVDAVYGQWNTPDSTPIRNATPELLRRHEFERGSMAPKVEAACRFVEEAYPGPGEGNRFACIGALEDVDLILNGSTGTRVQRDLPGHGKSE